MTGLALTLVLLSAIAHASWNFLLKRATNTEVFSWWMLAVVSLLLWPVAVIVLIVNPIEGPGWWYLLGTAVLHAVYFLFLSRAYARADLSVVYPMARGAGPMLVPILGVLILGETISAPAIAGIVAVVLGIYTVHWWGQVRDILRDPLQLLRSPGTRYALATGLLIATYSVWDKVGVGYVNPLLYMYGLSLGTGAALTPYVLKTHGLKAIRAEWQAVGGSILVASLFSFVGYGLVLFAFQLSRVSYVSPSREVGIVIGVLLGTIVLKEPFGRGRLLGSSLIVAGIALIAVAP